MEDGKITVALFFASIACTTVAGGCALGDRHIALVYQPCGQEKVAGSPTIAVVKFQDARQLEEVGEVRNAYGMKLAKVYAKGQDAGAWAANALAEELTQAGFRVEKFEDAAPAGAPIAVTGTVTEAYVKMYLMYGATTKVSVSVTKAGVPVLNKEYVGKGGGLAVLGTAGEYEAPLRTSLQQITKQMVPDIISATQ